MWGGECARASASGCPPAVPPARAAPSRVSRVLPCHPCSCVCAPIHRLRRELGQQATAALGVWRLPDSRPAKPSERGCCPAAKVDTPSRLRVQGPFPWTLPSDQTMTSGAPQEETLRAQFYDKTHWAPALLEVSVFPAKTSVETAVPGEARGSPPPLCRRGHRGVARSAGRPPARGWPVRAPGVRPLVWAILAAYLVGLVPAQRCPGAR